MRILRYAFFGLFCLLLFLCSFVISFPKDKLVRKYSDRITASVPELELSFGEIQDRAFGVTINDVEIYPKQSPELALKLEAVELDLLTLNIFTLTVPVKITAYSGSIDIAYKLLSGNTEIVIDNVFINRFKYFRENTLFNSNAVLNGNVKVNVNSLDARGNLTLVPANFNGKSKVLKLPINILPEKLALRDFNANFIFGGRRNLELEAKFGGDISGEVQGKIIFNPASMKNSVLNLNIKANLSETFREENDLVLSLASEYVKNGNLNLAITNRFASPSVKSLL